MSTTHEESLKISFYQAIDRTPEFAAEMARVRRRLTEGDFYPKDIVDAVFQKWEREKEITLLDAYGFAWVWHYYLTGAIAHCSVPLPSGPGADRDVALNQSILDQLPRGFRASFVPEKGRGADDDGMFTVEKGMGLWRTFLKDGIEREEPWFPETDRSIPIEVGTTKASKTVYHLLRGFGVARWPYGHNKVLVLLGIGTHFSINGTR